MNTLYAGADLHGLVMSLLISGYTLANKKNYDDVINDVRGKPDEKVNERLFKSYGDNLSKGVQNVMRSDDAGTEHYNLQQQLILNTQKFAASKSYTVTQQLQQIKNDSDFADKAKAILNTFNRYQATEYNASVSRSRTAKQWEEFTSDTERNKALPNMMWLPSRSVHPRELHETYYYKVLPKNDPFWQSNQPGNLWNCKCDWTETDEKVTAPPERTTQPAQGLQGNPAEEGQVFSDDATYFKQVIKNTDAETEVQKCFYQDTKSNMRINVWADSSEIGDNVRTGRVLLDNFKDMDIAIREHIFKHKHPNPEYTINNQIADAKRIEDWGGVTAGFKSALGQNCKIVVIDLYKLQGQKFNLDKLMQSIRNRHADFTSGKIKDCYVVYKNKAVRVNESVFLKSTNEKNKSNLNNVIMDILKPLFK